MIQFPRDVIGCPLRSAYQFTTNPSFSRTALLHGRPRHELEDVHPVEIYDLTFDLSAGQFNAFQTFWQAIALGVDWFTMDLQVDVVTPELRTVHATGPFEASHQSHLDWRVALQVEALT